MRVKILTHLKNGLEFIDAGTIFEGTEKTLPDFVLYELRRNRGTVEILPDAKPKKKKAARRLNTNQPIKSEAETPSKEKAATLREKLTKPGK